MYTSVSVKFERCIVDLLVVNHRQIRVITTSSLMNLELPLFFHMLNEILLFHDVKT